MSDSVEKQLTGFEDDLQGCPVMASSDLGRLTEWFRIAYDALVEIEQTKHTCCGETQACDHQMIADAALTVIREEE